MASEAGKGSKLRPTNTEWYEDNYDRIFKKKQKEQQIKEGIYYDSDSELIRDIRYDVKYLPEDHYEE